MNNSQNSNQFIIIKGAKSNNLNNLNIEIPKNKITVITGVSGSGKSTLAFNTIFYEGYKEYIKNQSSYSQYFIQKMSEPNIKEILGLSPCIALKQRNIYYESRNTIGTLTEIYDLLKILYTNIGKIISPISGNIIKEYHLIDIFNEIKKESTKIRIQTKLNINNNIQFQEKIQYLIKNGFFILNINNEDVSLNDLIYYDFKFSNKIDTIYLVIDEIEIKEYFIEEERLKNSLNIAINEGNNEIEIINILDNTKKIFSNKLKCDGIVFKKPTIDLFTFTNQYGCCKKCNGYGYILVLDEDLIIPNKNLSINEEVIVPFRTKIMKKWWYKIINTQHKTKIPIDKKYINFSKKEKDILWNGDNNYWEGINNFFQILYKKSYKIQYKVLISRYQKNVICPDCNGKRLRKEVEYIKVNNKSINDLVEMNLKKLKDFLIMIQDRKNNFIIIKEIIRRIDIMIELGLDYLNINRSMSSLSSGEQQRINITKIITNNLTGFVYILDEPSKSLHAQNINNLIKYIYKLKNLGNTIILVEHDKNIIQNSDYIIELGPKAGIYGGNIVFKGLYNELINSKTITAKYLQYNSNFNFKIKKKINTLIQIKNITRHNIKDVNLKIPQNLIIAITGVSGSGKTTLIKDVLFNEIKKIIQVDNIKNKNIYINKQNLKDIKYITCENIGGSNKSNILTYLKIYDDIKKIYSKISNLNINYFNIDTKSKGICENCKGQGFKEIEMLGLPDIKIKCEYCNGMRFKNNILRIKYNNKSIYDILQMTVEEGIFFFKNSQKIHNKLLLLKNIGLEYLKMGQNTNTLSGGEYQRLKLSTFLIGKIRNTLLIFDEPSIGLHYYDIEKLNKCFSELIKMNNHIIIIDHNLDIIKDSDWIIDLGLYGGNKGGKIIFEGFTSDIIYNNISLTGKALKSYLEI